jgi:UDP-2-acetamido-2-deoxy-ribo-hexuluronate aminotransferase
MPDLRIPMIDLAAQQQALGDRISNAIARVLAHGAFVLGPEVEALEIALAEYVGIRHAVSCSNGTDALLLCLKAHGIGPGDAVFTTPFTFIASAEVIMRVGARPIFVDIEGDTFNIDPDALAQAIDEVAGAGTLRPAAIVAVDLFGVPCDYGRIEPIAERHGMVVVEDAAQAFGACREGRRAGAFGNIGATSFYPSKPLGAYGDGGAVFTNDDLMAVSLRALRSHGRVANEAYEHGGLGLNARLDTIQAAVLLQKLAVFDAEQARRQQIAERYQQELADVVRVPDVPRGVTCAWAHYSVLAPARDQLRRALSEAGIGTGVYYPRPLHLQPAFAVLGYGPGAMPITERTAANILSLPMHPYLSASDQDAVISVIRRFYARARHRGAGL